MAPWYKYVEFAISCCAFAIGATLVVALPTLIAPSERATVARFMFWVGASMAIICVALLGTPMAVPCLLAVACGHITQGQLTRLMIDREIGA